MPLWTHRLAIARMQTMSKSVSQWFSGDPAQESSRLKTEIGPYRLRWLIPELNAEEGNSNPQAGSWLWPYNMHYESLEKGNKIHIKRSTALALCEYHIKSIQLKTGEAAEGTVLCTARLWMRRVRRWRGRRRSSGRNASLEYFSPLGNRPALLIIRVGKSRLTQ